MLNSSERDLVFNCGSVIGSIREIEEADDGIDAFSIESEKKNSCELRSMIKTDHLPSEHETKLSEMLENIMIKLKIRRVV